MDDLVFKQQKCGGYGIVRTLNGEVPDEFGNVNVSFDTLPDRPFGKEVVKRNVLNPKTITETTEYLNYGDVYMPSREQCVLEVGESTYVVEPSITTDPNSFIGGSIYQYGDAELVSTPVFVSISGSDSSGYIYAREDVLPVTISIYEPVEEVTPIPSEFIPEHTHSYDDLTGSLSLPEHTHSWEDLEDRPFGEESTITELFRYEGLCSVHDVDSGVSWVIGEPLIEDKEYIVNFDGVDYAVTSYADSYYDSEGVALGNRSIWYSYGNDTGEPFYIQVRNNTISTGDRRIDYLTEDEESHTIIIGERVTEINTIDPKYLPSADSNVFFAEYGVTTFDEILEAYKAGRMILARNVKTGIVNYHYVLQYVATNYSSGDISSFRFTSSSGDYTYYITITASEGWKSKNQVQNLTDSNKLTGSWNGMISDSYFPTSKSIDLHLTNNIATYLPKATAVADAAGETPTAAEFNALLATLRTAGYLATD